MTESTAKQEAVLDPSYSHAEEIANSITHGLGALLSVVGLVLLVTCAVLQNDVWRIVSFSVYGVTLTLLFLVSTLYHSTKPGHRKSLLKLLDHCAIYLLIAGTYTPFLLVSIRGSVAWVLFVVIWLLALFGVASKLLFPRRFHKLSVITYIIMGWLAVVVSKELMSSLSMEGMMWLIAGGVTYTLGVLFYIWSWLPFNHAIWHLFVLGGGGCHFLALYFYVLPPLP